MPWTGKHTHCYLCELLLCLDGPAAVNSTSVWCRISNCWTALRRAFPQMNSVPLNFPPLHSRQCLTPTFPGRIPSWFSVGLHPRAGSDGAAPLCPGAPWGAQLPHSRGLCPQGTVLESWFLAATGMLDTSTLPLQCRAPLCVPVNGCYWVPMCLYPACFVWFFF